MVRRRTFDERAALLRRGSAERKYHSESVATTRRPQPKRLKRHANVIRNLLQHRNRD